MTSFAAPRRAVALVWAGVIFIAYCRAFPPAELLVSSRWPYCFLAAGTVSAVLAALAILIAAAGYGMILAPVRSLGTHLAEKIVFVAGAGAGVISLLAAGANAVGTGGPGGMLAIVMAGGCCALFFVVRSRRSLRVAFGPPAGFFETAMFALCGIGAVLALIAALAPPTQFDSLVYHLALPARYLAAGRFVVVESNLFQSFPQNAEMIFQVALGIQGDIAANLTAWMFFLLAVLSTYALGRLHSRKAGMLAAALYASTPAVLFLAGGTYVDHLLAFYVTAALLCVIKSIGTDGRTKARFQCAAGAFAGLAAGVKYTGAASALALLLIMVFLDCIRARRFSPAPAGRFIPVAFLVFLPWLVRNTVIAGDPFAPWFTSWFPGGLVDPVVARGYFEHIAAHGGPLGGLRGLAALPWRLTVSGFQFGGAYDIAGPILLMVLPVLFLRRRIDTIELQGDGPADQGRLAGTACVLLCACSLAIWIPGGRVARFLFPVLPAATVLSALGICWLLAGGRALRAVTGLLFGAAVVHNIALYRWVMIPVMPGAFLYGGMSRTDYLTRTINSGGAMAAAVNRLVPRARVLFWGETRGYHCTARAHVPTVFDRHPLIAIAERADSAGDAAGMLRAAGYTHLFVNDFELERLNMSARLSSAARERLRGMLDVSPCLYRDRYCRLFYINPGERQ